MTDDDDGRSLQTTDHDVIRRWAQARDGRPAFVAETGGLLRIDFGRPTERLEHVGWDEWFRAFDERRLAFLYQETKASGETSTFFRLIDLAHH